MRFCKRTMKDLIAFKIEANAMKKLILIFAIFAIYGSVAFGLDIGIEKNKKLCDSGSAVNCFNTGFLLGYSESKAENQSIKYYKKACDLGIAEGCDYLGHRYNLLDGVKTTYYYSKACDLGYAISCKKLGFSYALGGISAKNNIKSDRSKYAEYLNKACDLGEASSYLELGRYYSGNYSAIKSVILDKQTAQEYYYKACFFDKDYCNFKGEIR